MFTMFTSTPEEKVLKGQKQYYLSNAAEKLVHQPSQENSNVNSKVDLSESRKFSADLSDFG